MKILIPAVKVGSFETEIHENFGRAEFFAIVDSENNRLSFISNTAKIRVVEQVLLLPNFVLIKRLM